MANEVFFPDLFWVLRKTEDSLIPSVLMFSLLAYKQIESAKQLPCIFEIKIAYNWSSQRGVPCREELTIFNHIIFLFFPDVFSQHLVWWILWKRLELALESSSLLRLQSPKVVTATTNGCGKICTEHSGGCQQSFHGIGGAKTNFQKRES